MLDLRRLSYFLAVASEGSFTRASRRLHVAQPALSRQVRLLEEQLGTPLLIRNGNEGVSPTPAGALLLERAPRLLTELEATWEEAVALGAAADDRLIVRLGYATSSGYGPANQLINAVRQRSPEVHVSSRVVGVADGLAALRDGTLDAALLRCPPAAADLATVVLRRERQGAVMRADDPRAAESGPLPTAQLASTPLVLHPREANPRRYDAIVDACRAAGFDPTVEVPLLPFDPAHQQVAEGGRATIVGDPAGALPATLVWRPLDPPLTLDLVLVTPLVGARPGVATVIEAAAQVAAQLASGLAPATASAAGGGGALPTPAA